MQGYLMYIVVVNSVITGQLIAISVISKRHDHITDLITCRETVILATLRTAQYLQRVPHSCRSFPVTKHLLGRLLPTANAPMIRKFSQIEFLRNFLRNKGFSSAVIHRSSHAAENLPFHWLFQVIIFRYHHILLNAFQSQF